jgi:hypothetical protein
MLVQVIFKSLLVRQKGVKHAWNYIDRDFDHGAIGRTAKVAAQPELGLLPERRTGTYPLHRAHSSVARPHLERGGGHMVERPFGAKHFISQSAGSVEMAS